MPTPPSQCARGRGPTRRDGWPQRGRRIARAQTPNDPSHVNRARGSRRSSKAPSARLPTGPVRPCAQAGPILSCNTVGALPWRWTKGRCGSTRIGPLCTRLQNYCSTVYRPLRQASSGSRASARRVAGAGCKVPQRAFQKRPDVTGRGAVSSRPCPPPGPQGPSAGPRRRRCSRCSRWSSAGCPRRRPAHPARCAP